MMLWNAGLAAERMGSGDRGFEVEGAAQVKYQSSGLGKGGCLAKHQRAKSLRVSRIFLDRIDPVRIDKEERSAGVAFEHFISPRGGGAGRRRRLIAAVESLPRSLPNEAHRTLAGANNSLSLLERW
jgi:hypothetical protein